MSGHTWLRAVAVRVALLTFGLIVALLAMELILQAAAAYTRITGRPLATTALTDRAKIMCLGDSNTFGILLPRDQTYPHYLELIWNSANPARPVEVLNFGFPGMNSSKLRKRLPELLETFHPDLVLVLIGSNDGWTMPVAVGAESDATPRATAIAWRYSRTFRFIYMLARGVQEYQIDFDVKERIGSVHADGREFDLFPTDRTHAAPPAHWELYLEDNVRAMAQSANAAGAQLVLLTYASHLHLYGKANNVLYGIGADVAPLIDLASAFRSVCPDGDCAQIFFQDQHPKKLGYQLFAMLTFRTLHQLGLAPAHDAKFAVAALDPEARALLNRVTVDPPPTPRRRTNDNMF